MTTVYKFDYNGNIASCPDSIPSYHVKGCTDNIQGEFVTLADYQAQQTEIETLKRLLRHWFELGPEFDILPSQDRDFILIQLEQLDKRTEEALK